MQASMHIAFPLRSCKASTGVRAQAWHWWARIVSRASRAGVWCTQVFKAMRSGYQVVAVKIFTEQMREQEQRRYAEAFKREITILRSCHDRNVVQFIGASLVVRT